MIKESAIRFKGITYRGRRHGDIFHKNCVRNDSGLIISSIAGGEQGFVTNEGIFLNREQAAEHALECGQIKKLKFSRTQLYSEDLY